MSKTKAKKPMAIRKPVLSGTDILNFAEAKGRAAPSGQVTGQRSGLVPEGDTRLTANIKTNLHRKLKHASVDRGRTIGELLEELIEKHL